MDAPGIGGGQYRLYGTLGCHLCDQARSLIERVLPARDGSLVAVDVAEVAVEAGLAERIPVLERLDNRARLYWPFTESQVRALCRGNAEPV